MVLGALAAFGGCAPHRRDLRLPLSCSLRCFKTVARNPVVRAALHARGLSDDELHAGWQLYSELNGFGSEAAARPASEHGGRGSGRRRAVPRSHRATARRPSPRHHARDGTVGTSAAPSRDHRRPRRVTAARPHRDCASRRTAGRSRGRRGASKAYAERPEAPWSGHSAQVRPTNVLLRSSRFAAR